MGAVTLIVTPLRVANSMTDRAGINSLQRTTLLKQQRWMMVAWRTRDLSAEFL
jgi:hypothetical protein